ncbi:MAG TPA: PIG-L family deacetylase [Eubacteriales bacterium]|nr:PIG-L family deacetylase [Eubacteriales bacterium]
MKVMTRKALSYTAALLCLTLLIPLCAAFPRETLAEDGVATDLSAYCVFTSSVSDSGIKRATDDDTTTHQNFHKDGYIETAWSADVAVAQIYVQWASAPTQLTVTQYDAAGQVLSQSDNIPYLYEQSVSAVDGAVRIRLESNDDMDIVTLHAMSAGNIANVHDWQPLPDKLDYLIISMHPDDDVLFMGAVAPTLSDAGYTGSIFYLGTRIRDRVSEALNGAWTMGVRCQPLMCGFPDIPPEYKERFESTFTKNDVIEYLVPLLRQYRPEVVFTHDVNGEYGHWQHIICSAAVQEAVRLAADPSYDPDSAAEYGVFEVKKLYLHLYSENKLTLNVTSPLASFNGQNALAVATEAFCCHVSQLKTVHSVTNEGVYSLSDFGLAYTTVGLDSGINDVFENIDPLSLSTRATPSAEPAPSAEPVLAPTQTPSEVPAIIPVVTENASTPALGSTTPTAEPIEEPSESTATSSASQSKGEHSILTLILALIAAAAFGLVCAALILMRRNRRDR